MKTIAFDFHGVLDTYPDFMKWLLYTIRVESDVIVLSGPPRYEIKKRLDDVGYEHGIHYSDILSVVDWLRLKNVPMVQDSKGDWWTADEESWWSSKSKICEAYDIHMLFDNSEQYRHYFDSDHPTKFILMR